jgi:hypothetical protein
MTQRRKTARAADSPPATPTASGSPTPRAEDEDALDTSDKQEIGPFDTFAEAMADMDSGDAAGWTPGETLAEAESEIGVSDWIDVDSGAPAEGQGPTHLERE